MTELHKPVGMGLITVAMLATLLAQIEAAGQQQSVRPGINDSFRDPNVDEFVERFEGESREVFTERGRIIEACRLKSDMTVADVGAGTGLYTRLFAKEVGPNGKVFAVDIAPKFLDHIARTAVERGMTNVETVLADDDATNLPPESVDLAFICDTYHHFEFPQRTMQSIHRALKPGGRLVVIDFIRIPGKSSDWILEHVRAGQEVVEREIEACGFRKVDQRLQDVLTENYFVEFAKAKPSEEDGERRSPSKPSDNGAAKSQ